MQPSKETKGEPALPLLRGTDGPGANRNPAGFVYCLFLASWQFYVCQKITISTIVGILYRLVNASPVLKLNHARQKFAISLLHGPGYPRKENRMLLLSFPWLTVRGHAILTEDFGSFCVHRATKTFDFVVFLLRPSKILNLSIWIRRKSNGTRNREMV